MSRTVAKIVHGLIDVATLPLNKRQREKTIARISQDIGRKSIREVATARGNLYFHAMKGPLIASAIERFHTDEPETLEWIDNFIKPGETLWDIGANIGLYALYAALGRDITVYAFEPSGLNFGLLIEHIQMNDMGSCVKPLCVALGDATKLDNLHVGEFSAGHASNALGKAETQFQGFKPVFTQAIPAFTADDFCRIFQLRAPDHIKLDVDGIEDLILAGAEKMLPQVKTLTVEVEGQNVGGGIEARLAKAGFTEEPGHREKGSKRNRLYVRNV